jgi:hypothetical protein
MKKGMDYFVNGIKQDFLTLGYERIFLKHRDGREFCGTVEQVFAKGDGFRVTIAITAITKDFARKVALGETASDHPRYIRHCHQRIYLGVHVLQ